MRSSKLRIAVLASGGGTTLQSIVDGCASGVLNGEVSMVVSNNPDSGALARAKTNGLPWVHLSGLTHPIPEALDRAIHTALFDSRSDIVVLAGYMKKVGPMVLAEFKGRIINTHPALLPKYGGKGMYGRRVYEAVLEAGEAETGISIHLVDADYDSGPVIAQITVSILPGDTVESLSERVQVVERGLLVKTLTAFAASETAPNNPGEGHVQPDCVRLHMSLTFYARRHE